MVDLILNKTFYKVNMKHGNQNVVKKTIALNQQLTLIGKKKEKLLQSEIKDNVDLVLFLPHLPCLNQRFLLKKTKKFIFLNNLHLIANMHKTMVKTDVRFFNFLLIFRQWWKSTYRHEFL